jgi:hypothetical protein
MEKLLGQKTLIALKKYYFWKNVYLKNYLHCKIDCIKKSYKIASSKMRVDVQ